MQEKIKKIILIIIVSIIALFLLLFFLPNLFSLFTKDITPINDNDLQLKTIIVAEEDNAYFDLIKIKDVIADESLNRNLTLDYVAGKIWDEEFVEEILLKNSQALAYFASATDKPKFQNPDFSDPSRLSLNVALPLTAPWRSASYVSILQALYLSKQEKDKEAVNEAFKSVKIGQKIQESQVSLVEYLLAVALKEIGLETAQKVIASSKLSSAELKEYVKELDKYENEKGLAQSFKTEYHFHLLAIDSMAKGEEVFPELPDFLEERTSNNFYFRPNKTKNLFAEYARESIENTSKFCGEMEKPKRLSPLGIERLYFTENAVSKVLLDVITISLDGLFWKKCENDLLISTTQILTALKAYKIDIGKLPVSLNELVPEYISIVPNDPFDGKPIRYSLEKQIIYSVGSNLIDSGGSIEIEENWREMPDPTFRIGF